MGNKVYKAVDTVLRAHSHNIKDLAVKMANTAVQVAENHSIKQLHKVGKGYQMTEDFCLFHRDLVNMASDELSLEIQFQLIQIRLKKAVKE